MMLVLDLFAGTRSSTMAFEDAGHTVISIDADSQFQVTEIADISALTADYIVEKYGRPDFIWASPPCTSFSVASIGHHWHDTGVPKTEATRRSIELVRHTRQLIEELSPPLGFVIENPRGMLRKLDVLADLPRKTVTYCQYGDNRMKPTDLWTNVSWDTRPACKNGATCHEAAPRGSRTGTRGRDGAVSRSMIPYDLGRELLAALS